MASFHNIFPKYFSQVFFPNNIKELQLLSGFMVFALGYITRPLGAVVLGSISDIKGRKITLIISQLSMAISTFLIGCLPSYEQIGLLAPISLIILRIIQGLSIGSELPDAIALVSEYDYQKRAAKIGYTMAFTGIGALAAPLICFSITHFFTQNQIYLWAWRCPFLLVGCFCIVVFFIRKNIKESPLFLIEKKKDQNYGIYAPLMTILKYHKNTIILSILASLFNAMLIILVFYFPIYWQKEFNINHSETLLATIIGSLSFIASTGLASKTIKMYGEKQVLICTIILYLLMLLTFTTFSLFSNSGIVFWSIFHEISVAFCIVSYFSWIIDIFPINIRASSVSICYNVSYLFMSFIPSVLELIALHAYRKYSVLIFCLIIGGSSLLSILLLSLKRTVVKNDKLTSGI
jgi:MFS family permease